MKRGYPFNVSHWVIPCVASGGQDECNSGALHGERIVMCWHCIVFSSLNEVDVGQVSRLFSEIKE